MADLAKTPNLERKPNDGIDLETIENLDKRFYEMATTVNSNRVRRGLLVCLQFSADEWIEKVASFDDETNESFVELIEAGAEYIQSVRGFADMLDAGMCRVINGFSENGMLDS